MKTPRRIRTVVVSVPVDGGDVAIENERASRLLASARLVAKPRFRPSDLLPWSDPYIASLVRKLQQEVRESLATSASRLSGEAEMPWNEPFEQESDEGEGFSIDTDSLLSK